MSARLRLRTAALAAIGAAALGGPVVQSAQAKDNAPAPKVTCEGYGGGVPGDTLTQTNNVIVNGKIVRSETRKVICGDDGKWHTSTSIAIVSAATAASQVHVQLSNALVSG